MKKIIFMAVAAVAMFASCSKMSPEATKAWNDVKEKAALVATDEACDKFESIEDYQNAFEAAQNAVIEFGKNFDGKVTKEVADSFKTLSETLIAQDKKMQQLFAAQQDADEEEFEEEGEEEFEEEVEE